MLLEDSATLPLYAPALSQLIRSVNFAEAVAFVALIKFMSFVLFIDSSLLYTNN